MKIAIFTELYPPSVGGQEIRFAEIAKQLTDSGHEVDVYTIAHERGLKASEVINGVRVFRMKIFSNYVRPFFGFFPRDPIAIFMYALWARKIAKTSSYDRLIYNQWPILHVFLAPKKIEGLLIVDWCEIRSSLLFKILQRYMPRIVGRNIGVSQNVCDHISSVANRECSYIPSGVFWDKYRVRPENERAGLLYVGRIAEHKNLGLLIDAFEQLVERGFKDNLIIAGAGPGLELISQRAKESKFFDRIEVLGSVSDDHKIRLLSSAKVFVITSRREGFPRTVAESMASGLPVVTVDFVDNGTRDVVIQHGCGLVADPDPLSIAQSVEKVVAQWSYYSNRCLQHKAAIDWAGITKRLVALN